MKKIMIVVVLCLFILLVGCADNNQAEELNEENATASDLDNVSESITEERQEEINVPISLPTGQCIPGWKCISSQMKAYRNESCGFERRIRCPLGCQNDTCRAATVCTSGFVCVNQYMKGYQTEACTTINDVECPGGCEEGECLFYNASAVQEAAAPAAESSPSPPADDSRILRMGQQEKVEINGEEHVISVYLLEPSRTKFSVDGFKTDWLEEGDTAHIRDVTITVKEILFQSFEGGKQQVRYTVE